LGGALATVLGETLFMCHPLVLFAWSQLTM
jgi:hypothetical protein